MCARYASVRSDDDIARELEAEDRVDGRWSAPDYNVAPTDTVRIVVNRPLRDAEGKAQSAPTRQLRTAAWGLVPSWAKDRKGAARMINARLESVPTKPAFRSAYAKRRCLIPADGWYEWQVVDGSGGPRKQPHYMSAEDGHILTFAGLYEFWRGEPNEPTLTTCTVITAPATGALADVHERMPLLIAKADWPRWLAPEVADPADLLEPWDEAGAEHLELRPVSTLVNKVQNDGPDLIAPVDPFDSQASLF